MKREISPILEGSSSYSLFYELSNGHVLQVYNDTPETQAELSEMVECEPEHAKEIEDGEKYIAIEYDPEVIYDAYAEDHELFDEGEAEDKAVVHEYGSFFGRDAEKNGLFKAIEERGLDITGRFTPYTTRICGFLDPKEHYERGIEVENIRFTGVNKYHMEVLDGIVELGDGEKYDFTYDTAKKKFEVTDRNGDAIVKSEPDVVYNYDDLQMNIVDAFNDMRDENEEIQFFPEISDAHISRSVEGADTYLVGTFKVGEGEDNSRLQFSYNTSTEELDITRKCRWYEGTVPAHLTEAAYSKAIEMIEAYMEKIRDKKDDLQNAEPKDNVLFEDDTVRAVSTGRTYDFIAYVENTSDEDLEISFNNDSLEGFEIKANDWIGIEANDEGWEMVAEIEKGEFSYEQKDTLENDLERPQEKDAARRRSGRGM